MCNGGFADAETIGMVQGPWGCNQMIRNHVGGNYAIPGHWGNAPGPAITSGGLVPRYGLSYDHRLTGPYGHGPMIANQAMISKGPLIGNGPIMGNMPLMHNGYNELDNGYLSDGYMDDYDWDYGRKHREKHKSKYKYRYTDEAGTNCVVM